jgi:hypothetical protein
MAFVLKRKNQEKKIVRKFLILEINFQTIWLKPSINLQMVLQN